MPQSHPVFIENAATGVASTDNTGVSSPRHGFSLENLSDRPSGLQIERGSTHRNARQWFIPGHDIDRHVIVTDIQRYLGNDATFRPRRGTGENGGVPGY